MPPVTTAPGDVRATLEERRRFLVLGGSVTLLVLVVLVGLSYRAAGRHLVYVIDDPAIHMSMARQLTQHGTWGVTAGVYEAASSSPLWTLSLAGISWLVPSSLNALPLLLNAIAAAVILWIFASYQTFVTPRRGDPWSSFATAAMPTALLFLPGLVMLGMEHLAHTALVLVAIILVVRLEATTLTLRAVAPLLAVLFIAGAVRVETVFLALGIAVAVLLRSTTRFGDPHVRWTRIAALRTSILAIGVAAAPYVVYGMVNKAFGRTFLPNSVVAKAAQGSRGPLRSPGKVLGTLATDPILVIFGLLAVAYLVWSGVSGKRAHTLSAVTLVVALLAQGLWGDIGWWNRYQEYLVVLGAFVICRMAHEVAVGVALRPALILFLVTFAVVSSGRLGLTIDTPRASSNTYRQRYQLGKFFARHYQGQPVATGELGYVTLFHEGPVLDLLGLGSHEIAVAMRDHNGEVPVPTVKALLREYDVKVIGIYPATFKVSLPPATLWQAGEWKLTELNVSGFQATVDFFAPRRSDRRPLVGALERYARDDLPSHVKYLDRDEMLADFFKNSKS